MVTGTQVSTTSRLNTKKYLSIVNLHNRYFIVTLIISLLVLSSLTIFLVSERLNNSVISDQTNIFKNSLAKPIDNSSTDNSNVTTLKVNGKTLNVPNNSTVSQSDTSSNGNTKVTVNSYHDSSGSDGNSTNNSSTSIDIQSTNSGGE